MQTAEMIKGLSHHNPKVRYQCVLVLGMVEETLALKALQQRLLEESEDHITQAIIWADERAQTAQQNGFTTLDAIFDHFQINRELASNVSPEEAELMRKMQQQLDSQLRRMESDSNRRRGQMALGAALGGGIVGGVGVGASMASDVLNSNAMKMSDGSRANNPALRVPPTQISDADISQLVKRLMQSDDPKRQRNAAFGMADVNNPSALPYLGLTFYKHPDETVKEAAEKAGKRIYWNINYLAMEQDGRLEQEMVKRRNEASHQPPKTTQSTTMQPASSEDISSILDRAQKGRKRRGK